MEIVTNGSFAQVERGARRLEKLTPRTVAEMEYFKLYLFENSVIARMESDKIDFVKFLSFGAGVDDILRGEIDDARDIRITMGGFPMKTKILLDDFKHGYSEKLHIV